MVEIIEKAKKGDKEAFALIYREHKDKVLFYASRVIHDENKAADIVQDVFIKVYTHISELSDASAFEGWLYKITLNECRQNFRREEKQVLMDEYALLEQAEELFLDDQLLWKDTREFLSVILDLLPAEQKRAIQLFYYEQHSIKEIALMENVSESSVKTRLFLARKKIKMAVEAEARRIGVKPFY